MYCIVPLAGPDFYNESYGIKPLFEIEGVPLIKKAIHSRCWYQSGELKSNNIIFALRKTSQTTRVVDFLNTLFTDCKIIIIPELTRGALMSSLAGLSLVENFNAPIVVDLIDIIYDSNIVANQIFALDHRVGGILPYFKSSNEKYSYLVIKNGLVTETAEKKVISDNASAGTYFFKNISVLLNACGDSAKNEKLYAVNSNLFLCPAFNGIIKNNLVVKPIEVKKAVEVSLFFH